MMFRQKVILFSQAGALPGGALREIAGKALAPDTAEVHKQVARQQAKSSSRRKDGESATPATSDRSSCGCPRFSPANV
jgi:hypothetical protein